MPDKNKRVVKVFATIDLLDSKDDARPLITYIFDQNTNKLSVDFDSERKEAASNLFDGFKKLRGIRGKGWDEDPGGVMDYMVARIGNQMLMAVEES